MNFTKIIAIIIGLNALCGCKTDQSNLTKSLSYDQLQFTIENPGDYVYEIQCKESSGSLGFGISYDCIARNIIKSSKKDYVAARGSLTIPSSSRIIGFAIISASGTDLNDCPFSFTNAWSYIYATNTWNGSTILTTNYWEEGITNNSYGWGLVDWDIGGVEPTNDAAFAYIDHLEVHSVSDNLRIEKQGARIKISEIIPTNNIDLEQ